MAKFASTYRGRVAPTPTGNLHAGHGRTFWVAWTRARNPETSGTLVYREEDLDPQRCKPHFASNATEDLRWLGLDWDEGPDLPGPFKPYRQSERVQGGIYQEAWAQLRDKGWIYPCTKSRKDLSEATLAPHEDGALKEPIYPTAWRPPPGTGSDLDSPQNQNWRFRVPDGEAIGFEDALYGELTFQAGEHFGDFLIWRKDGVPSYELAVVVDDLAMQITEVVRGADLLLSTARQILIYQALGHSPPVWFHCPLMLDDQGKRLAKRYQSLGLRELRANGKNPETLIQTWENEYQNWLRQRPLTL